MDEIKSDSQSFIVKVWVEERATETDRGLWRGHITHVFSSRRRYLENLDEIGDFIVPYLEGMGVKLRMRWSIRRWFKRMWQQRYH